MKVSRITDLINRYKTINLWIICVVFCSVILCIGDSVVADNKSQISDLEDEITANEKKYKEIQDKLDALNKSKDDLEAYITKLNTTYDTIQAVIDDLDMQIATKAIDIEEADKSVKELETEIAVQYEQMKLRIQYIYESDSMSMENILLSTKNIGDMLEKIEYVSTIMEYDRNQLKDYQNNLVSVELLRTNLQKEQDELLALKEQQNVQVTNLDTMMAEASKNIANHTEQIEQAIATAEKIEKEIEDAENTVEKLKEEEERRKQEEANKNNSNNGSATNKIPYQQLDGDIKRMAAIIWCEARGESYEGQVAVGTVVMNRVESPRFPNTIEGVISQKGQFSPYKSGKYALALSLENMQQSCIDAAVEVITKGTRLGNWLFFRMKNGIIKGDIIGCHVFY